MSLIVLEMLEFPRFDYNEIGSQVLSQPVWLKSQPNIRMRKILEYVYFLIKSRRFRCGKKPNTEQQETETHKYLCVVTIFNIIQPKLN